MKADPSAALAAERQGRLIGSNFVANWGSFGFFGPLSVLPEHWGQGAAQQLVAATMEIFRRQGNRHLGLYTFAQSPKHMVLYQKFGFWPRDLVAVMSKSVAPVADPHQSSVARFSELKENRHASVLEACRGVTEAIFEGFDVTSEIQAVATQVLGDTVLVYDDLHLAGFAVCHVGAGTEAGSGVCFVKFAAVRPGPHAESDFAHLIKSCESLAAHAGAQKLSLGVNLARREAFRHLFAQGFRTDMQGVAMETGDGTSGYNHPGVYVLDDWR